MAWDGPNAPNDGLIEFDLSKPMTGAPYVTVGGVKYRLEPQNNERPADEVLRLLDARWNEELQAMMRECFEAEKAYFTETDELLKAQGPQPIGVLVTRQGAAIPVNLTNFSQRVAQKKAFGGE